VYDASLTLALPVATSVASGLNALAHCVDSMWAPRTDRIDQCLALEAIRTLRVALPQVAEEPGRLPGREEVLYGAYLAAVAFASAGSGLHHKICHVLGGMLGLPHAETHAVVLPYVLAFNAPFVPDLDARMAEAFGSRTALEGVLALRDGLDAPRSLRELGMAEDDVRRVVGPVLEAAPTDNPGHVTRANVEALLRAAWEGRDPT
jgi:alcohol dehydrogenase class IV